MIGRTLKNYVVEELLGKGGMGAVYRARDTKLDRNVAIKVLPPELMRDEERRRRFIHEAKAASAVNHPAIAQIYEIEDETDLFFIVMEFVDGSTVRQLAERAELDALSAVEIGIQVGDALSRAHAAGIVHRDIKSDNIMVTRDGHPKVLDFGLAKLLDVGGPDDTQATLAETVAVTQAGMVLGTVAYMSPEQARGLPVDHRSDVFSFGVVLYEMASGKLPFQGQSALDTMHAIAFNDTQPLSTLRAGLPYSLQSVVDRCLQKEPENRYAKMDDAVSDLKRVRREIESGVTTSAPILSRLRLPRTMPLPIPRDLTARGVMVIGFWSVVIVSLSLTVLLSGGEFAGVMPFLILALIVFAHVRGRRGKLVRRFAKKASKLKEVRMVRFEGNEFTIVVVAPKARTYVKLNAHLESTNSGLYSGSPFTMSVRENVSEEELHAMVMTSGVQFLRD
jgi:serine/threonine protein kinase